MCFYSPWVGLSLLLCRNNAINTKRLCASFVQGLQGAADGSVHNASRALLPKAQQEFKERAERGPAGPATVWV